MLRNAMCVLVIGLAASPVFAQPAQPPAAKKVLVFPFAVLGEEARKNAEMFRTTLINEIDRMEEVDSVEPESAERTLGRSLADARDGCAEDKACTAAVGKAVGARYIVKGGVAASGGGYTLSIQLFDTDIAETVKPPRTMSVPSDEKAVNAMRSAAAYLFATSGFLELMASVAGAEVFVDGRPVGKSPLPKPLQLPMGRHNVRLTMVGFEEWQDIVEIRAGATSSLRADLKRKERPIAAATPRPPPPPTPLVKKPLFWAIAGGALLAVGAGTALALSSGGESGGTKKEYDDQPSTLPPNSTIAWP